MSNRAEDKRSGKYSKTKYTVLDKSEKDGTVVFLLEPKTGRTHQLRVHLKSLGLPIIGDSFYSGEQIEGREQRLYLHAFFIKFNHPALEEYIECSAPLGDDFKLKAS